MLTDDHSPVEGLDNRHKSEGVVGNSDKLDGLVVKVCLGLAASGERDSIDSDTCTGGTTMLSSDEGQGAGPAETEPLHNTPKYLGDKLTAWWAAFTLSGWHPSTDKATVRAR